MQLQVYRRNVLGRPEERTNFHSLWPPTAPGTRFRQEPHRLEIAHLWSHFMRAKVFGRWMVFRLLQGLQLTSIVVSIHSESFNLSGNILRIEDKTVRSQHADAAPSKGKTYRLHSPDPMLAEKPPPRSWMPFKKPQAHWNATKSFSLLFGYIGFTTARSAIYSLYQFIIHMSDIVRLSDACNDVHLLSPSNDATSKPQPWLPKHQPACVDAVKAPVFGTKPSNVQSLQ